MRCLIRHFHGRSAQAYTSWRLGPEPLLHRLSEVLISPAKQRSSQVGHALHLDTPEHKELPMPTIVPFL